MTDQSADEAEILDLIHRNRIAVWMQDFAAYERCFVHADYTTRWNAAPDAGTFAVRGWEEIAVRAKRMFGQHAVDTSHSYAYDTEVVDLRIRVGGDMAWAAYRQKYPLVQAPVGSALSLLYPEGKPPTDEVRVFERHAGEWRIAFLGFLNPDSIRSNSALLRLAADGTIEWQNEAAIAILAGDDDLVVRNGRLRVRDAKTDAKLQAAIAWAARLSAPMVPSRGSLPVVMEAGEGVPVKVWWVIAENGRVLVSLNLSGQDQQRLDAAAIIFELSPAQKQVAAHIIAGKALTEIAAIMGVTPNTARTHLDRIFDKIGVRTQPALVRVLLSTASPV